MMSVILLKKKIKFLFFSLIKKIIKKIIINKLINPEGNCILKNEKSMISGNANQYFFSSLVTAK
tara:strand:- start:214 stop:405 length:192 start_codon:yes stop_codon:yes gene_type:complete